MHVTSWRDKGLALGIGHDHTVSEEHDTNPHGFGTEICGLVAAQQCAHVLFQISKTIHGDRTTSINSNDQVLFCDANLITNTLLSVALSLAVAHARHLLGAL